MTVGFRITLNKPKSKEALMSSILKTKRLVLRPVDEQDLELLAEWEGTGDYLEFVSAKKIRHHLRYVICVGKDKKPVGILYTFSYNKTDGFMFLNVFIEKRYRRAGYGAEACIVAICHIFDELPVYKIYCDAFARNTQSIAMMKNAGLKQEGFLRGHRLYRGERYDVVRFAVHHENLCHLRDLLYKFKTRGGKGDM